MYSEVGLEGIGESGGQAIASDGLGMSMEMEKIGCGWMHLVTVQLPRT